MDVTPKLFLPPSAGETRDTPYAACRDHVTKREARERLEAAWSETRAYMGDDEAHFLTRFRGRRFHSAAWELYLRRVLLDVGLPLEKTASAGPDVCTVIDGRRTWIEATTVEPGEPNLADSVVTRGATERGFSLFPVEQLILRLTNTLDSKLEQVRGWIDRDIVQSGDAMVLALNYGTILDADLHDHEVPALIQAVFAVGTPVWIVPVGRGAAHEIETVIPPRHLVAKANGSPVRTDLFLRPESACITGLLYARQLVWNLRWDARRDLGYVHNPIAKPLPHESLPVRSQSWSEDGAIRTEAIAEVSDGEWVPRPLDRPSTSASAARRAERERIAAMSPRERALLSLRLGDGGAQR